MFQQQDTQDILSLARICVEMKNLNGLLLNNALMCIRKGETNNEVA